MYRAKKVRYVYESKRKSKEIKEESKGERWMPWLTEAMKDVISCDKPGVGANIH